MLPKDARLVSVDDHLVEPPHLWSSRLPARFVEAGPRVVVRDDGVDVWQYAGQQYETGGTVAIAGRDVKDFTHEAISFHEMRPGCYDPKARLEDLDEGGVYASLAFPTFCRFAGHRFLEGDDRELAKLCVQAFNDFILDEWCAVAPERLIPLMILPMWDVELCVQEVERTAALGAKAVAFTENPVALGLPSIHTRYWDPMFAALEATDLAMCQHIGSSGALITSSEDAPYGVHTTLTALGSMIAAADLLFSHVFHEHPGLRVVLSEGGAGWVPYLLERADWSLGRHRYHANLRADLKPSELFARNLWVCIIHDEAALTARYTIGVDKLMWECDYPHSDSIWPHSRKMLEEALVDLPDDEALAIGETNARRVFRLG